MNRYSYLNEDLIDAMAAHKNKFTLIDARIISLIYSYSYSGQSFFASNKYLAEKCFTTPATIQKSINKLIANNLISKQVKCVNGHKQRLLSYNKDTVEQLISQAAPQATLQEP